MPAVPRRGLLAPARLGSCRPGTFLPLGLEVCSTLKTEHQPPSLSASHPESQLRSRRGGGAPCGLPVSGSQARPEQTEHEGPWEWCLVCNKCKGYTTSERRSCLLLPPLLQGLGDRSEPTAPHSTIAPQTQLSLTDQAHSRPISQPKGLRSTTEERSPGPSGADPGAGWPSGQTSARQSPHTVQVWPQTGTSLPSPNCLPWATQGSLLHSWSTHPEWPCTPPSHTHTRTRSSHSLTLTRIYTHMHTQLIHTRSVTFTQVHTLADSAV